MLGIYVNIELANHLIKMHFTCIWIDLGCV